MKNGSISVSKRMNPGILLSCLLLWGCAAPLAEVAPNHVGIAPSPPASPATDAAPAPAEGGSATDDIEVLRTVLVAKLSPDEVIGERNVGQRIRWAGAVMRIAATDEGVCLTILYAQSGEDGFPLWTNRPTYQNFEACSASAYDPTLVREHTNVTIIGRTTGVTHIGSGGGGRTGAVVQIERLFRWSDCLAGDPSPECKIGFLNPQTPS
ncbi:Outer membrane lipoprotein Slp family protein [compost metagenome]